jgi:PhnB protein
MRRGLALTSAIADPLASQVAWHVDFRQRRSSPNRIPRKTEHPDRAGRVMQAVITPPIHSPPEETDMQLVNYLFFRNQAAEAFDFYARCLGGKIVMKVTLGEMPDGGNALPETRDLIAHVRLAVGDAVLMGSDWCTPTGEPYPGIHGNAVSLSVNQPGEAERLFAALSEGANVSMPMAETSWALRFGMLTDRYGAMWMVNCNRPA